MPNVCLSVYKATNLSYQNQKEGGFLNTLKLSLGTAALYALHVQDGNTAQEFCSPNALLCMI